MNSIQRKRWAALLIAAGLGLTGWGVRQFVQPPQYRANARVKVGVTVPELIPRELEALQSKAVLDDAFTRSGLEPEWAARYGGGKPLPGDEARRLILERLKLVPIRGTSLIEIRVTSTKPDETDRLANAVAAAYQGQRLKQRERSASESLRPLKEKLADKTRQLVELQQQLHQLNVELETVDSGTNTEKLNAYTDLKQKVEDVRQTQGQLEKKLGEERLNQRIPDFPTIELIHVASLPRQPLPSGRKLGTILMCVGGLSLVVGGLFLKKPKPAKLVTPAPPKR